MTSEHLVTARGTVTLEQAEKILMAKKVEKLLLVDENNRLTGLITIKDIDMMRRFPQAAKDRQGRLRVGAAVGVFDYERAGSLIGKDVDFLVVDSAHGHSANVIETVREVKKRWDIDVVAGNVATRDGARDLVGGRGRRGESRHRAGIDLHDAGHFRRRCAADHGDLRSGAGGQGNATQRSLPTAAFATRETLPKRIAAGANAVMIGGLARRARRKPGRPRAVPRTHVQSLSRHGFARRDGPRIERTISTGWSRERTNGKLVPEGVEGRVPYKGSLSPFLYQLVGGLRAGMGYCGAKTIDELRTEARFIQITAASVRENHPHDIAITQEAPNYSAEYSAGDGA